ncbi:MAG: hydroxysqualene dehydroxylase HpnE, partial [Candidatus Binatia bacterium]
MRKVVVVGGGVAGLSAALALADRGARVRLFEKRAIAGGRAYSYRAREAGHAVDNGQHLLMGCYSATLRYLERIGSRHRVEVRRLAVPLADGDRGRRTFGCAPLPSPIHLTAGVLRYRHLSVRERGRLLAGGLSLVARHLRGGLGDATVAEALDRAGQGERARASFWSPLAIAVLNELPERASAALFGEVLRRVFFARAGASRLVFPAAGLSDLLVDPAVRAIERAGGEVEIGRAVREIVISAGRVSGVRFHDGGVVGADAVVAAVPPPALLDLLPQPLRRDPAFACVERLRSSPIVSVHLWLREPVVTPRMLGFLDGPLHWLFTPPMQPSSGRYVTLVASGARDLAELPPERILDEARRALRRHAPEIGEVGWSDSLVAKERAATFAATPAEQPHR